MYLCSALFRVNAIRIDKRLCEFARAENHRKSDSIVLLRICLNFYRKFYIKHNKFNIYLLLIQIDDLILQMCPS